MRTREEIEERLKRLREEERLLLSELNAIASQETAAVFPSPLGLPVRECAPKTTEGKLALFAELFTCRENVYPKLWHNPKTGHKGYSPACDNEWVRGICDKPRIKCSDCPNQAFPALDQRALRRHLEGHETIGTYAIRSDDTSVFLATDFDGGNYREEALAFKDASRELGVAAEIERSRSGNGAHVWIFFSEPVPASLARRLGTAILARATAIRHTIDLKAFDRFFPNQDLLPKGGFGNLIALPLQKKPREAGNTAFVDESFLPHFDQWQLLSNVKRLSRIDVDRILSVAIQPNPKSTLALVEDSSILEAEKVLNSGSRKIVPGSYTGPIDHPLSTGDRFARAGGPRHY